MGLEYDINLFACPNCKHRTLAEKHNIYPPGMTLGAILYIVPEVQFTCLTCGKTFRKTQSYEEVVNVDKRGYCSTGKDADRDIAQPGGDKI